MNTMCPWKEGQEIAVIRPSHNQTKGAVGLMGKRYACPSYDSPFGCIPVVNGWGGVDQCEQMRYELIIGGKSQIGGICPFRVELTDTEKLNRLGIGKQIQNGGQNEWKKDRYYYAYSGSGSGNGTRIA